MRRPLRTSEDPPPRASWLISANEGCFAAPLAQERAKIHRRRRLAERSGRGVQGTSFVRPREGLGAGIIIHRHRLTPSEAGAGPKKRPSSATIRLSQACENDQLRLITRAHPGSTESRQNGRVSRIVDGKPKGEWKWEQDWKSCEMAGYSP